MNSTSEYWKVLHQKKKKCIPTGLACAFIFFILMTRNNFTSTYTYILVSLLSISGFILHYGFRRAEIIAKNGKAVKVKVTNTTPSHNFIKYPDNYIYLDIDMKPNNFRLSGYLIPPKAGDRIEIFTHKDYPQQYVVNYAQFDRIRKKA